MRCVYVRVYVVYIFWHMSVCIYCLEYVCMTLCVSYRTRQTIKPTTQSLVSKFHIVIFDPKLFAVTIITMSPSDSKELSVLRAASERLIDSDGGTIDEFCHSAADVSAFEDALQQCSTEHFRTEAEAALSVSTSIEQQTMS
jgi:hypothetical protein